MTDVRQKLTSCDVYQEENKQKDESHQLSGEWKRDLLDLLVAVASTLGGGRKNVTP